MSNQGYRTGRKPPMRGSGGGMGYNQQGYVGQGTGQQHGRRPQRPPMGRGARRGPVGTRPNVASQPQQQPSSQQQPNTNQNTNYQQQNISSQQNISQQIPQSSMTTQQQQPTNQNIVTQSSQQPIQQPNTAQTTTQQQNISSQQPQQPAQQQQPYQQYIMFPNNPIVYLPQAVQHQPITNVQPVQAMQQQQVNVQQGQVPAQGGRSRPPMKTQGGASGVQFVSTGMVPQQGVPVVVMGQPLPGQPVQMPTTTQTSQIMQTGVPTQIPQQQQPQVQQVQQPIQVQQQVPPQEEQQSVNVNVQQTISQSRPPQSTKPPQTGVTDVGITQVNPPIQQQPQTSSQIVSQSNTTRDIVQGRSATVNIVNGKRSPIKTGTSPGNKQSRRMQGGRQRPPWVEFTGEKKSLPIFHGWANRVRQVISGDTLKLSTIIRGKTKSNTNKKDEEKTIILDGIRTPKVQRWSGGAEDPFGFEAREFVRQKVMNKQAVYFAIWKENLETTPVRYFGDVYVFDKDRKPMSLTQAVVEAGFAEVGQQPTTISPKEYNTLDNAQSRAKQKKRGKWEVTFGKNNKQNKQSIALEEQHKRTLVWIRATARKEIYDQYKDTPNIPGIVDGVLSGSRLRVELMPRDSKLNHKLLHINLAGCNAPRMPRRATQYDPNSSISPPAQSSNENTPQSSPNKKSKKSKSSSPNKSNKDKNKDNIKENRQDNKSSKKGYNRDKQSSSSSSSFQSDFKERPGDQYCNEAKQWTEDRLLGQDISVTFRAIDKAGNIYATVNHANGQIASTLLKQGLSDYEQWTANACPIAEKNLLIASVQDAQKKKIGIWQSRNPDSQQSDQAIIANVVQIVSGDTMIVRLSNGKEERFTLSSIRSPRIGVRGSKSNRQSNLTAEQKKDNEDEPYAREAKEFLRVRTIGKKVQIFIEYTRERIDPRSFDKNNKFDKSNKYDKNNKFNKNISKNVRDTSDNKTTSSSTLLSKGTKLGGGSSSSNKSNKKGGSKNSNIQTQTFATVYVESDNIADTKDNIAELLVRYGLAKVIGHPPGQKRSRDYEKLGKSENDAMKQQIGIHNTNPNIRPISAPKDLSLESDIRRDRIIHLQNTLVKKKLQRKAIVEFLFSGNRFKLYLPDLNLCIPVNLAGIRCDSFSLKHILEKQAGKTPKKYKKNQQGPRHTKWGEAAYNYVRDRLLQREVKVTIVDMKNPSDNDYYSGGNRGGGSGGGPPKRFNTTFWGHIYYDDKNISEELLEYGLAETVAFYPSTALFNMQRRKGRGGYQQRIKPVSIPGFDDLQKKAKENNIGFWRERAQYNEEQKLENKNIEQPTKTRDGDILKVIVSHIESGTMFFVNDASTKALEEMEQKMSVIKQQPFGKTKSNKIVAGLYNGLYGRARIHKPDQRPGQNNQWFVMFIDYGNRASINKSQMTRLPDELGVKLIPPLAIKCQLAGLRAPPMKLGAKFFKNAGIRFAELTMLPNELKILTMKILYDDWSQQRWFVELFDDPEMKISINKLMVGDGHARISKQEMFPDPQYEDYLQEYLTEIKKLKQDAQDNHAGMWYYGGYDSDDEQYQQN